VPDRKLAAGVSWQVARQRRSLAAEGVFGAAAFPVALQIVANDALVASSAGHGRAGAGPAQAVAQAVGTEQLRPSLKAIRQTAFSMVLQSCSRMPLVCGLLVLVRE
jgi:hypothetical protein